LYNAAASRVSPSPFVHEKHEEVMGVTTARFEEKDTKKELPSNSPSKVMTQSMEVI
jgi:hypothetical protein